MTVGLGTIGSLKTLAEVMAGLAETGKKAPFPGPFSEAEAGFEPATSGL
jgi:hypothetical protein